MTPYTPDAVAMIRMAMRSGQPVDVVREQLGWAPSMFENVCRLHGIERSIRVESKPEPFAVEPQRAPQQRQGKRMPVTVALSDEALCKLTGYAESLNLTVPHAAARLVDAFLDSRGAREIEFDGRSRRKNGQRMKKLNVGLSHTAAKTLKAEAKLRRTTCATPGTLAKAIIVAHFFAS